MFDTWLLRSFVAVAETGGFTTAAKLLNSTQSTISAQVHRDWRKKPGARYSYAARGQSNSALQVRRFSDTHERSSV
jgi:Bacterial regulatory helix-turn-helix protein, lysR family